VLFTSGVGYFQRSGNINGSAAIPLTFRTSSVDDILKSLILIDPAGKVEPATYTSQEPVSRVLQSFGIDISQNLSMVDLLEQLRGAPVELTTKPPNPETITGQVLSVETRTVPIPRQGESVETQTGPIPEPDGGIAREVRSQVNLLTDTGIRSILLSQVDSLKILDPKLADQLKSALAVLAANHDTQQKTVTLHFGAGPERRVEVGYVTEAPIWKTSYRLSIGGTEKPFLQGWAMVDNPSDQDWNQVNLTLVSGQPISFIQDLYTPLYIPRPVVPPETQANPYPQLSEEKVTQNAKESIARAGSEGGYPGMAGGYPGGGGLGGAAEAMRSARASRSPETPSAAPPAMTPPTPNVFVLQKSGVSSAATARKAGELFQYQIRTPVTIPRQQSAMIPIVTDAVKAQKLDVYNPDVDSENPENAVDLTNTTDLHLKAGPVTIFDGGSYAGDARMPDVEPGGTQLLTYAVDLGITGVRENQGPVSHMTTISIQHGLLKVTSKSEITTKYTLKSKLAADRVVYIEQPIKDGWDLVTPAKPDQKTRSLYRFRVPVPAESSTPFTVTEDRLNSQTIGLIDADVNLLLQYRSSKAASPAVQAALADLAQRKQHIAALSDQLAGQKGRIDTISTGQARIRQNMAQLDKNSDLYKRYVTELNDQETQIQAIQAEIDRLQKTLAAAQADYSAAVDKLDVG